MYSTLLQLLRSTAPKLCIPWLAHTRPGNDQAFGAGRRYYVAPGKMPRRRRG